MPSGQFWGENLLRMFTTPRHHDDVTYHVTNHRKRQVSHGNGAVNQLLSQQQLQMSYAMGCRQGTIAASPVFSAALQ